MADIRTIAQDPDFQKLPIEEQRKAFIENDKDFGMLPVEEQDKGIAELTKGVQKTASDTSIPSRLITGGAKNVKDIAKGTWGMGQAVSDFMVGKPQGVINMASGLLESGRNFVVGAGGKVRETLGLSPNQYATEEQKKAGKEAIQPFLHPVDYMIDNPVNTALLFSPSAKISQTINALRPTNISRRFVKSIPSNMEHSMMERAMKPSTVLSDVERGKRVETALNEGIATTKRGVEKSKNAIKEINTEIQQKIDEYTQQGAVVNTSNVMKPSAEMAKSEIPKMAYPEGPTKQIVGAMDDFAGNPNVQPEITLRQAQNYKQSINKELDDFYSAINSSPDKTKVIAEKWTNKTKAKIADGLREEISNIFPEIRDLNTREASLIQLNKSLTRAVNRISQHDIWSLKGVVSLVAHPKYAVMNYIVNNPAVQSNLAIVLRKARQTKIKPMSGTQQGIQVGMVGAENLQEHEN